MTTEKLNSVPEEQVGTAEDAKQIATVEPADEAVAVAENDDVVIGETEAVSFAEEDAALAAEAPEFKLENDEIAEESAEVEDRLASSLEGVAEMNKSELVDYFASLLENKPVQNMRYDVEAVKVAFYKKHRAEIDEAKKKYAVLKNGRKKGERTWRKLRKKKIRLSRTAHAAERQSRARRILESVKCAAKKSRQQRLCNWKLKIG